MRLPVRIFFAFYREGAKMEARQFREHLDITMAPAMKLEYYKTIRGQYNRMIFPSTDGKLPERPVDFKLDAGGSEAKKVIFSVFRSLKRSHGYG